MSPTLLELALAIVIVVIAWQIGVAIAPTVLRQLRAARREIDEAADAAETEPNREHEPSRTGSPR